MLDTLPEDALRHVVRFVAFGDRERSRAPKRSSVSVNGAVNGSVEERVDEQREQEEEGSEDLDVSKKLALKSLLVVDSRVWRRLCPLSSVCRSVRRDVFLSIGCFRARDHGQLDREHLTSTLCAHFPLLHTLDLEVLYASQLTHISSFILTHNTILSLASHFPNLRSLSLSGLNLPRHFSTTLSSHSRSAPNSLSRLLKLDLSACRIPPDALDSLADCCPVLESLDLSDVEGGGLSAALLARVQFPRTLAKLYIASGGRDVTDDALARLVLPLPRLCVLDLDGCENVSSAFFERLAANARPLQVLALANCPRVGDHALRAIADVTGPNLRKLVLSFSRSLSINALHNLITRAPNLRNLELVGLFSRAHVPLPATENNNNNNNADEAAPNRSVCEIIGELSKVLEVLSLSASTTITSFVSLSHCETLQELDLSYCSRLTSNDAASIASFAPSITRLSVSHCPLVSDSFCRAASSRRRLGLSAILSLNLSGCDAVSEAGLLELSNCIGLTELDLDASQNVSDAVVVALCRGIVRSSLSRLSLAHSSDARIGPQTLAVCATLPRLAHLDLSYCTGVDASALISARSEPSEHLDERANLRTLRIAGCDRIDGKGLEAVMKTMAREVQTLDCSKLGRVDDEAIEACCAWFGNVRRLQMTQCGSGVTQRGVLRIAQSAPRLESVQMNYMHEFGAGVGMLQVLTLHDADCARAICFYLSDHSNSNSDPRHHHHHHQQQQQQSANNSTHYRRYLFTRSSSRRNQEQSEQRQHAHLGEGEDAAAGMQVNTQPRTPGAVQRIASIRRVLDAFRAQMPFISRFGMGGKRTER